MHGSEHGSWSPTKSVWKLTNLIRQKQTVSNLSLMQCGVMHSCAWIWMHFIGFLCFARSNCNPDKYSQTASGKPKQRGSDRNKGIRDAGSTADYRILFEILKFWDLEILKTLKIWKILEHLENLRTYGKFGFFFKFGKFGKF